MPYKKNKTKIFSLSVVFIMCLVLVLIISGCGQEEKKKPAAPEIQIAVNTSSTASANSTKENEELCQKKGGAKCNGCCKKTVFSNQGFSCCDSSKESCVERIQTDANFNGLGLVSIERFSNGNYGVWYGDKDPTFGNRLFVNAVNDRSGAVDDYIFTVNDISYRFSVRQTGCSLLITGVGGVQKP